MSVGTVSNNSTTSKAGTGFNGLTSDDFFKLLITQLQSQDPTEPMSNDQLLSQLATMRGLQSDVEMGTVLKDLSAALKNQNQGTGQKLSVGSSFIGQSVTFKNGITGLVTAANLRDGNVLLKTNNSEFPLEDVEAVNSASGMIGRSILGIDVDGKPVFGKVTNSFTQNGKEYLQVQAPNKTGQLEVVGEVPFDQVATSYSFETLLGQYVQARTPAGQVIEGVVSAPKFGNADKSKIQVGEMEIPLSHVLAITKAPVTKTPDAAE